MPTINQLIRQPRVSVRVKSKSPALENSPQKRVLRLFLRADDQLYDQTRRMQSDAMNTLSPMNA